MKIVFLAGLISALCLLSITNAAPADEDIVEEPETVNPSTGEEQEVVKPSSGELAAEDPDNIDRENVVGCRLGSWACKVHCWSVGKKGGFCSRGTCYCR